MPFTGKNYGKITNRNSAGSKSQGVASTTTGSASSIRSIRNRAGGQNRNFVFCMNQLGGVGRGRSPFGSTADGVVNCIEGIEVIEGVEAGVPHGEHLDIIHDAANAATETTESVYNI